MISPFHGVPSPFELPSNIVYFHDWRYVNPGSYAWRGLDGQKPPLFTTDPLPPLRYEYHDMPLGIRLRAIPAVKTEPVITPDMNNEIALFGGNLIHEQGLYRLWYETWAVEEFEHGGDFNLLKYAESDDGETWRFPELGVYERDGSKANNVVFGRTCSPVHGYHGGCAFRDPSAPPEERYKLFHLGRPTKEDMEAYRQTRPDEIDAFKQTYAIFGGVSPDGYHWTHIPEPLVIQTSDTHNVCEYDPVLKRYVAYCRSWLFHRRTIGRTATDDFRRFPLPEELFWPSPSMPPQDTWYANAKTSMPDAPDYHVMFPKQWRMTDDSFCFHLATSPDNVVWNFVPGGAVCLPGDPGAWDGGVVAPGVGMVNLPGRRIGILFAGCSIPHKHPRRPPVGALGWATWRKGRLVALDAKPEGAFSLWPLKFTGRSVRLNFKTPLSGFVKVEAADEKGAALPGHTFDDCDWLVGDHLDQIVTWKGQSDIGHADGAPVLLRFRLRNTELYSVEFK
ncbi:MAG: hypothetical protein JXA11_03350 [Phycisphaerae bacterium]|nr:hypothetical protein [Phycisphaerae bacterium]